MSPRPLPSCSRLHGTRGTLCAGAALLMLAACSSKTPFPAGLGPLEASTASWPADGEESLSTNFGEETEEDDGYHWGHARAYVQQPIETVYAALRKPRVTANRRSLADYTVEWDVEPEYTHSYVLHNRVEDLISFEFDVTWRHGALDGSEAAPVEVGTRWQKTEGSDVIELQRGSVYTWASSPEVTALELVVHQRSMGDDATILVEYLDDFYADILAASHGEPLRDYPSGL